jgi:hypothetical protein
MYERRGRFRCSGCQMDDVSSHWACENAQCTVTFHTDCRNPMAHISHAIYEPISICSFHRSPNDVVPTANAAGLARQEFFGQVYYCSACSMEIRGYFYRSISGYNLHPQCAHIEGQTINYATETGTIMRLRPQTTGTCSYCNTTEVDVRGILTDQIWSYEAGDGSCLHIHCMLRLFLGNVPQNNINDSFQQIFGMIAQQRWLQQPNIKNHARNVLKIIIAIKFQQPQMLMDMLDEVFN